MKKINKWLIPSIMATVVIVTTTTSCTNKFSFKDLKAEYTISGPDFGSISGSLSTDKYYVAGLTTINDKKPIFNSENGVSNNGSYHNWNIMFWNVDQQENKLNSLSGAVEWTGTDENSNPTIPNVGKETIKIWVCYSTLPDGSDVKFIHRTLPITITQLSGN